MIGSNSQAWCEDLISSLRRCSCPMPSGGSVLCLLADERLPSTNVVSSFPPCASSTLPVGVIIIFSLYSGPLHHCTNTCIGFYGANFLPIGCRASFLLPLAAAFFSERSRVYTVGNFSFHTFLNPL